jgi:hypothetical protein
MTILQWYLNGLVNYTFELIQPINNATPTFLDTASTIYSLRKVRSNYNGNAIRVRRSNDNAEANIGFSGNDLDVAGLLSFVGVNSGFVTTWYDQSDNSRHAIQATNNLQPLIVEAGLLNTVNSKPYINAKLGRFLESTNTPLILPYTANAVANRTSGTSYQRLITATAEGRLLFGNLNEAFITATGNQSNWNNIATVNNPTRNVQVTPRVLTAITRTAGTLPFIDSQAQDNRTGGNAINSVTGLWLFKGPSNQNWIGNCAEVVIFPSELSSTDRLILENIQKVYYQTIDYTNTNKFFLEDFDIDRFMLNNDFELEKFNNYIQ